MKRLLTLTLFGLLTISCASDNIRNSSKGASMSYNVHTQAELDAANQRINGFKQDLLRHGFHEVSTSFLDSQSNSKEEFILEGQYGALKELRVTLSTVKQLENDYASLLGGIDADLSGDQAERDFEELYNKVAYVVTGIDTRPR